MRITAELLREKKACEPDIKKFLERWPEGCEVTPENCEIAFGGELDMSVDWAAEFLLSTPTWAKYSEVVSKSWVQYIKITAPVYKERDKAGDLHRARVWAKCVEIVGAAAAEDLRVRITAFCELAQQST